MDGFIDNPLLAAALLKDLIACRLHRLDLCYDILMLPGICRIGGELQQLALAADDGWQEVADIVREVAAV